MSPPVGALSVNTRSRWTTWSTANVAPPTRTNAVRYWTMRSVGHGAFNQRLGGRVIRRPMRGSSGGLDGLGSGSWASISTGGAATPAVTGAILPSANSVISSPARHQDQTSRVERHVGEHVHPQPAGAQRADPEHQAEQEQTRILDDPEVDDGEPGSDEHDGDGVVQPAGERT